MSVILNSIPHGLARITEVALETVLDRDSRELPAEMAAAGGAAPAAGGAVGVPLVSDLIAPGGGRRKSEISRILRLPFGRPLSIRLQNLRMPNPFLNEFPFRRLAIAIPILLTGAVSAQSEGGHSPLAQRELERRQAAVQEAQMLLLKGDEAYQAGKFKEAMEAYAGASGAFPEAPATAELKAAATQRYAQAAVEYGRELSRKGDVAGAKAVVDKVLEDGVAPDDPLANAFRADLDDPIRTNPALTKEHAADIDEVRRLLYMAQGEFDLGKYDAARARYEDIIRIDPHNAAARRGLERVAAEKSAYSRSAQDHTRAEMLAAVDGGWELPLAPELIVPDAPEAGMLDSNYGLTVPLSAKLERIIIPEFRLQEANLTDAIELLQLRTAENDTFELDPARKGINIAVSVGDLNQSPGKEIYAKRFNMQVRNVPVATILKYINGATGTVYRTDEFAVTISPVGMDTNVLVARTYRVPPDFLSNLTAGAAEAKETEDIFNTDLGGGGLLTKRMGVQEALAQQGIIFGEGASASLNASTNTLRVINTEAMLDIIEQIIDSIAQTEPVSVAVRVTMMKVEQERLEEIGFDWMLNTFTFGGDSWIPGASKLNLSGGTTGNGSAITDIANPPGNVFPTNPITAGNRSGDGAISGDSLESLIAAGSTGGRQSQSRAPGVFGVNGTVGDATVQMLMRGLNQKTGVDLMAQPSVTTRSGQAASILIVEEFIYPTEYEPPELPSGGGGDIGGTIVTPATPTAFEQRDLGIILEVLPVADANRRYVDVTLNPQITDFDGFVNYGSPINTTDTGVFGPVTTILSENAILMPIFSTRRVDSNLVVADGATIVIGGMLKQEITDVQDKTPILGDIPVVGRLFQSEAESTRSVAVLFLVNVELLDPTGRPYRDR
jgi:general secretion pathway protein D